VSLPAVWTLLAALAAAQSAAPPAAGADSTLAAEAWIDARTAYDSGDYAGAVALYLQLLEEGHDGGHLHYNLGNAYLRNGELGRAIASYRRAGARLPRDRDLAANLEFARQTARDAIAPPSPPVLLETVFFWHFALSRAELAWLVAALNLLFWACLGLRLWRPRMPGTGGGALLLAALLLATGGSLALRHLRPQPVVVIVPQEVTAYTAPDSDSTERFRLHAGSELRLAGRRDGWLRVALPSGEQGWIESGWAEVVEI
jgi:tetratricopeptide (TPR) repeat protein